MLDALVAWGTVGGVVVALVLGVVGLVQSGTAKREAVEANRIAGEANALVAEANRVIRSQADRETERSDVAWDWRLHPSDPHLLVVQNIGKTPAMDVVVQFFLDGAAESNHQSPVRVNGQEEVRLEVPGLAEARHQSWEAAEIARLSYQAEPAVLHNVRLRVAWNTPLGSPKLLDTGPLRIPLEGFARVAPNS